MISDKFSLFFSRFWLLLLMLPSACAVQPVAAPQATAPDGYRSELADPAAKAAYAYAEYRLLAADSRWDEAIAALRRAVAFDPASIYLRMNLAKLLLHKDQADESIELLRAILQDQPESLEAHELLGDLLGYRQQNEEAVAHYRQALTLDPQNRMLRLRLAMALGRLERNQEAIELLEQMVAEQPEAILARLSLARFYQESQQPEKARASYRDLLQQHPEQAQAIIEYGQLLEQDGKQEEALQLYLQGVESNPHMVELRQRLMLLYLHKEQKGQALEQLRAMRQLLPDNPKILERLGLLLLDMERYPEAETAFREVLPLQQDDGRNRYYLGVALLGQQKYQQAIEVMAPIKSESPVFVEAALQLAYLYRQAGQLQPAIGALEKLLAQDIQRPEIYSYLVSFYGDSEQLEKAAALVAQGLQRYPQNVELLYQAALISEKQGDREQALKRMRQVLEVDAQHADALNFIAYHHAEKGTKLNTALEQAKQALQLKRSGYIVDTLGWIYYKLGRFEESREQLEEANSLLPEDPVILEHLGDLYRALNLWQQAAEAYRKSLQLDPLAAGVKEKLQTLPQEGAQ